MPSLRTGSVIADSLETPNDNAQELSVKSQVSFEKSISTDMGIDSPLIHIQHTTSGTNDTGTFSAGAWRTRPLNTLVHNSITGASFDDQDIEIILPAGKYYVEAYSCAFYVDANYARLFNLTNGQQVLIGEYGLSNPNAGYNNTGSTVRGRFTLNSTSNLQLQHYCQTSRSTTGFGYNSSALDSQPSAFADVRVWRVGEAS